MLLGKLSDKVKSDVQASNRGEKPAPADPPSRPAPRTARGNEERLANTSAEAYDPTTLKKLPEGFLSRIINTQDNLPEKKRHNEGYLHLSDLLRGVCARAVRFSDERPDSPIYNAANGGQRLVWKIGRAVEQHIRDSYIKGVKGKGVLGEWSCKCGAVKQTGVFSEKWGNCGRCRTAPKNYGEVSVYDHDAGIVGNPDFPVYVGDVLHVTEIKSMNKKDFDALTAPVPDHIFQAAGYRRLLKKNGYVVSDKVIILYATKDYMFGSPYKEFHVNVNKPEIDRVLDNAWKAAQKIREARIKGVIPREKICSSTSSPAAKKCAFCTECFSRS